MPPGAFRPELQALRAVAVLLVVLYHLWPARLPGGYVGVDVFFVLSGFLITSHLLRELEGTGRIDLPAFWARRARRLLPASLLVLLVSAAGTVLLVPATLWRQFLGEIAAAAVYAVNWLLAANAVDYLAAENIPSPVQHFWSLSAEEQFYLVWPLLLMLVAALVRPGLRRRTGIALTLAAVTVASFACSVLLTAASPAAAYFVTPTRAWEFGVGALLALVPATLRFARLRALLGWLGIAALVSAAVLLSGATPFPGSAALLPVLGAAAIVAAGSPAVRWSPTRGAAWAPLQFLGNASYSIYLWHWPLLIFAPYLLGAPLGTPAKLGILVTAVVLGRLSLVLVEDPARRARVLTRRPPRATFLVMAAGMATLLAIAGAGSSAVTGQEQEQAATAAEEDLASSACYGAAAMAAPCTDPELDGKLAPTPLTAHDDAVRTCMVPNAEATLRVCDFGVDSAAASTTVALVGDSHAGHWLPALETLAQERGWHIISLLKGSCPFADAVRHTSPADRDSCLSWNRQVRDELERRPEVSAIFVSGSSKNTFEPEGAMTPLQTGEQGYRDAWSALPASVRDVVVLRDVPRPREDVLDCLAALDSVQAQLEPGVCSRPRGQALLADPAALAAEAGVPRVSVADLTGYFCTAEDCLAVVGHAVVYRDGHHITASFARSLAPFLGDRLPAALRTKENRNG